MTTPAIPVAIEISGLTKDFPLNLRGVKLRAVENLTLSVPEGKVFGLLGPNGSGKSTTLKMILGLLHPTRGQLAVLGRSPVERGRRVQIIACRARTNSVCTNKLLNAG